MFLLSLSLFYTPFLLFSDSDGEIVFYLYDEIMPADKDSIFSSIKQILRDYGYNTETIDLKGSATLLQDKSG